MRKWTKEIAERYIKQAKEKGLTYWSAVDYLRHHKTMHSIIQLLTMCLYKGANMNIYKEKICTNCANNNCTHKIEEVQEDKATVIKCNDFICKEKRKKVPRNW